MEDLVVPVFKEYLEDDNENTERQDHGQPPEINFRGKPGKSPEDHKKNEKDTANRINEGRVGDGDDGNNRCKGDDNLDPGIEPVNYAVTVGMFLNQEELFDHGCSLNACKNAASAS